MKKIYLKITILIAGLFAFNACNTDELKDLNINPLAANEIDPSFVFAYTQLQVSGERYENWRANLIYSSTMVQHLAALPGYWSGDKYLYNAGYSASYWERGYRNYMRDLAQLIEDNKEDPEGVNTYNLARIWRVFALHRMTDLYGDIPYFDAGRGFIDSNFNPKYDPQAEIYPDMLKELEEASQGLSVTGTNFGSQDFIYGGDINLWKKFANSLMLRLAMRMQKADPASAQAWVQKAIAGGVMESNDDIAYLMHSDGPDGINRNGIGEVFDADDNQKLSKTFIDWLKDNNDPRLMVYSGGIGPKGGDMDLDPANQNGLPNGYDATTIKEYEGTETVDIHTTYSRVNPLLVQFQSPVLFQTYSEVEFLLAEASLRGWHSGDAATHYNNGVRASMKQWALYDPSLEVSDDDIQAYLDANPFETANGFKMIGEQIWATTFLNEYEAYANYRRTGFPELVPVDYPGNEANGQIPRRLRYPTNEASVNAANYEAAVGRLENGDSFTSRMWWDN